MSLENCKLKQNWILLYTCKNDQNPKHGHTSKCWQRCGTTRTLIHWCLEGKTVSPLWKTAWQFLTNLNILLPYNPAVVLLGIYSNELKIYVHARTCRSFTVALFIIVKTQKQTCLSIVLCLVAESCPTLCDPMDCSPPGSSVHGDSPGKNTGVGCHALLQGTFPTQGSNPGLPHCRQILYCLSHQGIQPLHPYDKYIEIIHIE